MHIKYIKPAFSNQKNKKQNNMNKNMDEYIKNNNNYYINKYTI